MSAAKLGKIGLRFPTESAAEECCHRRGLNASSWASCGDRTARLPEPSRWRHALSRLTLRACTRPEGQVVFRSRTWIPTRPPDHPETALRVVKGGRKAARVLRSRRLRGFRATRQRSPRRVALCGLRACD